MSAGSLSILEDKVRTFMLPGSQGSVLDAELDKLSLDSFRLAELVFELEESLDRNFSNQTIEQIMSARTVRDIANAIGIAES